MRVAVRAVGLHAIQVTFPETISEACRWTDSSGHTKDFPSRQFEGEPQSRHHSDKETRPPCLLPEGSGQNPAVDEADVAGSTTGSPSRRGGIAWQCGHSKLDMERNTPLWNRRGLCVAPSVRFSYRAKSWTVPVIWIHPPHRDRVAPGFKLMPQEASHLPGKRGFRSQGDDHDRAPGRHDDPSHVGD